MSDEHSPSDAVLPCLLDGYTDLPPGKLATLVTYLAMTAPPDRMPAEAPADIAIHPYTPEPDAYRALFRAIGEDWLWAGRLRLDDAALEALLADPGFERFALFADDRPAGLLELDFRGDNTCELAYFGLVPDAVGKGNGRFLMDFAILRAFARPISSFFVHTCHFDHPGAFAFYRRCGFTPYKLAIEIMDDPRHDELLPQWAAAHVPFIPLPGSVDDHDDQ